MYWRKEGTDANNIIHANTSTGTFTLNEDCRIRFWFYSTEANANFTDIQIELGSTATSYEPYQGDTYDITFPSEAGTVYGGTLDVTDGVLTVDRAMVDLGTLTWTYNNGQLSMVSQNLSSTVGNGANVICSMYKTMTNLQGAIWSGVDKAVGINKANSTTTGNFAIGALVIKDTAYTDAATFKTAMSGVQLCYELATPITYTLTPQEIRTLLGTNNVWADTGGTSVTYRADTKLFVEQNTPESPVQDVQVNGTSVLQDGVANVPIATGNMPGAVKVQPTGYSRGIVLTNDGIVTIDPATSANIKGAGNVYRPIIPPRQHEATFYGIAKAAGDTTQSASSNAVGAYTESAKSAISTMLNGPVTVTGSTPTITALAGVQYVCGEVSTLDITLPASGCVDVRFTSGSTPTVLTVTPPTGVTVKWAGGFDPTSLDANTTYEINIADGLGVAGAWT
jgi:hypothetical protein